MRVARLLARLLAAAAAMLITAVFDPGRGLASTQPGFSTRPGSSSIHRSARPN